MEKVRALPGSCVTSAYIVSGLPHILLAHDRSPAWQALYDSYARVREEITRSEADVILYFSTQWLSVLGYLFQADPSPEWTLVDHNWHEFGSMPYKFKIDTDLAAVYSREVKAMGHYTREVNYRGFPIDTGVVVAQKLLNPDNQFPAAMVSCNMYAEKQESLSIGQAAVRALEKSGKKAIVVLVSGLSSRYEVKEINPKEDKISSLKDDEWNRKILDLLAEGRLEDVSEVAREFARQANADMGGRGIWWLNGLCGKTNDFRGEVFDYQPAWGTGAALVGLYPTKPIRPVPGWVNDEADLVERLSQDRKGSVQTSTAYVPAEDVLDEDSDDVDESVVPLYGRNKVQGLDDDDPIQGLSQALKQAVESVKGMAKSAVDRLEESTQDKTYPWQQDPAWRSKARKQMRAAFTSGESVKTWQDSSQGGSNSAKAPPPVGPYPHSRRHGDLLFLSGVGPRQAGSSEIPGTIKDENGQVVDHDVAVQTRATIENVKAILEAAGSSLENVLDVQVFLTNMANDFEAFNKVYAEYFAAIGPTRTTVEVTSLPTPICVELKVIARP